MRPYYDDGQGIVIYHGDCRDVLPTLAPGSVDLVLTDPPYGIAYSPGGGGNGWGRKTFTGDDDIAGDDRPFDPAPLLRFPRLVLFGANHYADRLPPSPSWIVWDKRDGYPSKSFADCEMIWTNLGGPARIFRHLWDGAFRASEKGIRRVHPTQKPLVLMRWLVSEYTEPGALILDPYMGSGTTLRAAKDLGRRCIGIEVEERWCEIAATRLQQSVMALDVSA
jgi:site-specific DNA-methyltransferase (adenine-specific)/modification methylase